MDGRWDITEDSEFVLSARGKKIAEREKGSSGNRKLISPGSKCGVTTTEDESTDEFLDEKRAVMRHLEEYNLTHESYGICHLRALRRKGFGSPLDDYELDILDKRGDED